MNRNRYITICIVPFFALLIMLPACKSSRTSLIAGKTVRNIKERYALCWGCPIRWRLAESYWVYSDSAGRAIKHGGYQHFSGEGRLDYEANFLDGKQDGIATTWNTQGEITEQTFWRMGQNIGWANYSGGHLEYAIESVYEDNRKVATKKFEGQWSLGFVCGNKIDLQIDEQTGALVKLRSPYQIACQ